MGIFNNYAKPGPGVGKNELKKARPALYFEILFRKFWNICLLNLIFVLFMLPFIALSIGILYLLRMSPWSVSENMQVAIIFSGVPFMFCGPVFGAAAKISRDFAREEPVFIWSDFIDAMKKNLKQTIALSAISYFLFASLSVAVPSYFMAESWVSRYIFCPITALFLIVVIFMQYYIYTMAVSFDFSLKQLLKNAFIFSFVCLFKNLLITLIIAVLVGICAALIWTGVSFSYFLVFGIFLAVILLPALVFYTIAFVTFPSLQKYVIDPYYESNPEETSAVLEKHPEDEQQEKELPEYVYHNGRMVHRSVLENEVLFQDSVPTSPAEGKEEKKKN